MNFDMSSQKSQFLWASHSEEIAINEIGLIDPKLHTYTTFFYLKFIFQKKLHVVVGNRFFFVKYRI